MKYLVTGGSGFIGGHLVEELIAQGHEVTIFDKEPPIFFETEPQAKYIGGDIRDLEAVISACHGMDGVFHLAGVLGTAETMNSIVDTADINVVGSLRVFEAIRKYRKKAVYVTIGNDWENPYTITKTATARFALMYNREFGTKITVIRGLNVYGSRQKWFPVNKFFPRFCVNYLNGEQIPIYGDGEQLIDVVYVGDVVEALIKAMETDFGEEQYEQILDAGTGHALPVNEVVRMVISEIEGRTVNDNELKKHIKYLPMRPGEPIKSQTLGSVAKINEILNFVARTTLKEGFEISVDWYKENYKDFFRR